MTNTNTQPSKMTQARAIYDEIFTRGYQLNGKTQRAVFIERCMEEVGLTKNGASTYYQNISNKVNKGMKLYAYNKPSKKKTVDVDVKVEEAKALLMLPLLDKYRWMVVDQNGTEVNCFKSRAEAQAFAKVNEMKWMDRNKAA